MIPIPCRNALHVIPVGNGEPLHCAHGSCWCFPVIEANKEDPKMSDRVLHNAKDCREKWERQDIKTEGATWASVWGISDEVTEG